LSTRLKRLPPVLLLLALLAVCGLSGAAARSARGGSDVPAVTPTDFAGFVLMSGFRPIAVDILWMRAEDLVRQRRYFELLSLYKLITALDPHFDAAWAYNAYNLAYDLAMLEDDPDRRWRWTREAILYATEGMKKNPRSDRIAFMLAAIFYYRIGRDDALIERALADPVVNPERKSIMELARPWAELGFRTRPHTIYIDWMLEFIYRDYAEHATDPAVKLEYQRKRLAVWQYVKEHTPLSARAAESRIREIEAAIAEIESNR
jgi:hypothetical protein